jgi:hypothetical protein
MTHSQSLLDFILNLLRDSDAKAAFVADPQRVLANAGLGDVCAQDVSDAMSYVSEYHPVAFVGDRKPAWHGGGHDGGRHDGGGREHDRGWEGDRDFRPDSHASAVQQLQYVTNNYAYTDSHDTLTDKSVHQSIWNRGELSQSFDDHSVSASDHSVAAGRDITGDVANGDHNVVGRGNEVGNTSYRDDHSVRDAFNGNNIADHGGIAGRGNEGNLTNPEHTSVASTGGRIDNSRFDSHDSTIRDSFNDNSTHTRIQDSNNDHSHHTDIRDSNNHTESTDNSHYTHIQDSANHTDYTNDSHNTTVHTEDSHDHDNAITNVDQHGLINTNLSPAVNLPIHDNDTHILDHHS